MFKIKIITIIFVIFSSLSILSYSDTTRDIKFVELLNKNYQMYDYSILFLEGEIATKPKDIDFYKIKLGETLILSKEMEKGIAIINEIPPMSEAYTEGQRALGIAVLRKGKFKQAIIALEKYVQYYIKYCEEKDLDDELLPVVKQAIGYLAKAYELDGQAEKSGEVIGYYPLIDPVIDERLVVLVKLDKKLDGVEEMKIQGKAGWEKIAEDCINRSFKEDPNRPKESSFKDKKKYKKALRKYLRDKSKGGATDEELPSYKWLRWGGRDAITANSYIGEARAYFLLGKYKESLDALKIDIVLIQELDKVYQREDASANSPAGAWKYWAGRVFYEKSKESASSKKIKYLRSAFRKLISVANQIEFKGHKNSQDAFEYALKIQKEFEKLEIKEPYPENFKPPNPKQINIAITPAKTEVLLKAEKYAEAIPQLQKALSDARTKSKFQVAIPKCLSKLMQALLKVKDAESDGVLEVQAISSYLEEFYPESKDSAEGILRAGYHLWQKDSKEDAVFIFNIFLNLAPANKHASDIATQVALHYYNKAKDMGQIAQNEKTIEARDARLAEMLVYCNKSIKQFQWILDNCAHTERVNLAYYMLGACYNFLKEYDKALASYLKFCEVEKEDLVKVANAKLGSGSVCFKKGKFFDKQIDKIEEELENIPESDKEEKITEIKALKTKAKEAYQTAIVNLVEFQKWVTPEGKLYKELKNITKVANVAIELLGYSYEASDQYKNAIDSLEKFVNQDESNKNVPRAMSVIGNLYAKLEDYDKAGIVLEELSKKYPESEEGKNALFSLVKSMYKVENYEKCIDFTNKIFQQKQELSIAKLRWIAKKLATCEGKSAGIVALKAAAQLFELLKKPVYSDWLGKDNAKSYSSKKLKSSMDVIKESLEITAAKAAFISTQYKTTMKYLDSLLTNQATPYLYKGLFLRAETALVLKNYENARKDLKNIASNAYYSKEKGLGEKAKYLIGETYEKEGNTEEAFASYKRMIIGLMNKIVSTTSIEKKELSPDEIEAKFWKEKTFYKIFIIGKKLKKNDELKKIIKVYKVNYPNGKYIKEIK